MYFVYILRLANGDLYKGMTTDMTRRMHEHRSGTVTSTKPYLPLHLIGWEAYALKSDAERRELFLKTTEGRRLTKRQYRDILAQYGGVA